MGWAISHSFQQQGLPLKHFRCLWRIAKFILILRNTKNAPLFYKKGRFYLNEQAVSRVLSADCSAVWPSILAHRCRSAHAITESLAGSHFCGKAASALIPILHRVGFTGRSSRQAAGELLPRLSILTRTDAGGIFLLHFPWSRLRRTLSGTLPCGARTFLMRTRPHAATWLTR